MTLARSTVLRDDAHVGRPRSMTEDQIREALLTTEGNITSAAKILGVGRQTLSEALTTWARAAAPLSAGLTGRPAEVELTQEDVLRAWEESGTVMGVARLLGIGRFPAQRELHRAGLVEKPRLGRVRRRPGRENP